ncbi:hypothetical protein CKAH01_17847 [Colletotrichum kahawae]|uniref:Ankyrin repeat protein n=1 Tax=Colletotrichum kahawae TaxID=34407 RepID=A0AAE0D3T0_COLKA|nr:hypothetical protein CKAH01_17847 [Colletotrichum kahawae]
MFELSGHCGSALQAASLKGYHEIVQILLEHGANPNPKGHPIDRPIHIASERNHVEIVRLLLKH